MKEGYRVERCLEARCRTPVFERTDRIYNRTVSCNLVSVWKLTSECNHEHLEDRHFSLSLLSVRRHSQGSQTSSNVPKAGVPTTSKIFVNWSIWSVPANNGLRMISSAMIQPTDQISTFSSYRSQLMNTSGARHQLKQTDRSSRQVHHLDHWPSGDITRLQTTGGHTR